MSGGAFAISRPVLETIVVNRSHQAADFVMNGAHVAGQRTLHGTLGHEMSHGAIRAHFGLLADWRFPTQLREGYSDFVAQDGSLNDGQAAALIAAGEPSPALTYWKARKRVAAELARNGGSVDTLFVRWSE